MSRNRKANNPVRRSRPFRPFGDHSYCDVRNYGPCKYYEQNDLPCKHPQREFELYSVKHTFCHDVHDGSVRTMWCFSPYGRGEDLDRVLFGLDGPLPKIGRRKRRVNGKKQR